MRMLLPVLAALSGCYLVADGNIDTTCDDIPTCRDQKDTTAWGDDSGGGGGGYLSRGVAYSATDGESWTLLAFDPPDFAEPVYQRGGQGAFAGPILFDSAGSRAAIATQGRLYVFGATVDQITSYEVPSTLETISMAWVSSGLCLITDSEVFWQSAGSPDSLTRLDEDGWLDGERLDVFADEDGTGLYLLTRSSTDKASLYHFEGAASGEQIAQDFVANPRLWLGGGGFIGPERAVSFCSTDGGVHALDDLVAGSTAPIVKASTTADVLRCGWDSDAARYLLVTTAGEIYALAPDGSETTVLDPLDAALTAAGAFIY